jgi:arylsulfatase A-like enzyme
MKPNIVFILTDQWRAQALGYAGDPNVETPNIDALAERSINCVNAVSVCPVCTPARAALLTGRYPTSTGMFLNDLALPADEVTIGKTFKQAGYDTGYIGKWHVDGHGRDSFIPPERQHGWDYWKVLECTHDYMNSFYYEGDDPTRRKWDGYDAYAQTKDAQSYIQHHASGDKPFFLTVSFGGPHFPHHNAPEDLMEHYRAKELRFRPNVPEEQFDRNRKELPGYYAHCTAIDRCVGDLFTTVEEAGLLDNTIFIFTSDHGDMHGSQGKRSWRKQLPWDESACVPLLCHYPPMHDGGRRVSTVVTVQELYPTLCSLAGVNVPESAEFEDASRFISGEADDPDRAALIMAVAPFAGELDFKAYRGVRTSRYTYVRDSDGPWLLYDNHKDPFQMNNLVNGPAHADLQAKLETELQRQLDRNGDEFLSAEQSKAKWDYTVQEGGAVPYNGEFTVQGPGSEHRACTARFPNDK